MLNFIYLELALEILPCIYFVTTQKRTTSLAHSGRMWGPCHSVLAAALGLLRVWSHVSPTQLLSVRAVPCGVCGLLRTPRIWCSYTIMSFLLKDSDWSPGLWAASLFQVISKWVIFSTLEPVATFCGFQWWHRKFSLHVPVAPGVSALAASSVVTGSGLILVSDTSCFLNPCPRPSSGPTAPREPPSDPSPRPRKPRALERHLPSVRALSSPGFLAFLMGRPSREFPRSLWRYYSVLAEPSAEGCSFKTIKDHVNGISLKGDHCPERGLQAPESLRKGDAFGGRRVRTWGRSQRGWGEAAPGLPAPRVPGLGPGGHAPHAAAGPGPSAGLGAPVLPTEGERATQLVRPRPPHRRG